MAASNLVLKKGVNRVSGEHVSDETDGRDFVVIALPLHKEPVRKKGTSKRGFPYDFTEACPSLFGFTEVIDGVVYNIKADVSRPNKDL